MTENNSFASPQMDDDFRSGLSLLWQANTYAQDSGAELWDFALEIDSLYETGMTISDLRWLVAKGYVQHGQETSVYGAPHRSFHPSDGLNFTNTTCFVLTSQGSTFAVKIMKQAAADG